MPGRVGAATVAAMAADHPVALAIDYPERPLNRLTTAFRPFVAIPILILLGTVSGGSIDWTSGDTRTTVASAGGLLFLGPLLMILFRGRYPGWWFDWNLNLLRFGTRVAAYIALLDDRYPSTEDEQAVHLADAAPRRRRGRHQPRPAAREVVPRHPPLHRPRVPVDRASSSPSSSRGSRSSSPGATRAGCSTSSSASGAGTCASSAYAFLLATDAYPPFRLAP